jgi:hypothetical protein
VDDLEDARRADGFACSTDDAKLAERVNDLAQLVPAVTHVTNDRGHVLFVLVDLEGHSVVGESLPPSTLA